MALQSIPIPPDALRDRKARELLAQIKTWHPTHLRQAWGSFPAGTPCLLTPNGWYVNAVACTCPDYEKNERICKHIRAVALADQQAQTKPVKKIEDLWPTCRVVACDNDPEPHEDGFCWRHVLVDAF